MKPRKPISAYPPRSVLRKKLRARNFKINKKTGIFSDMPIKSNQYCYYISTSYIKRLSYWIKQADVLNSNHGSYDQSSSHAPATPCLPDDFDAVLQAATPRNALAESDITTPPASVQHPGTPKTIALHHDMTSVTPTLQHQLSGCKGRKVKRKSITSLLQVNEPL